MEYNMYGNSVEAILDELLAGDLVEYIDARTGQIGKRKGTVHVTLQGIWDGQQVQFDDKERL